MTREAKHIGPKGHPTYQYFLPTLAFLLAALALALLSSPAWAAVQRPAKPPLPNPMPRIVKMTDADPMADQAAGYWDGQAIHIADPSYRFGVRHELGHVYDEQVMDAGERQRFASLQACDGTTGCDGTQDLPWLTLASDPGSDIVTSSYGDIGELFADAYAACRSGRVPASGRLWETAYGYNPTQAQHRRICKMIARSAVDTGSPLAADGWR